MWHRAQYSVQLSVVATPPGKVVKSKEGMGGVPGVFFPPFSQFLANHTLCLSLCLCFSSFARTNLFPFLICN